MNTHSNPNLPLAFSACMLSLALLCPTASAQAQKEKLKVVEAEQLGEPNVQVDGQTFEIRIDNGDVTVRRNGQLVPKEQIKNDDGRIVIVDEDGEVLKDFMMHLEPFHFNFNNGEFDKLRWFAGEQGPPPKVMLGVHMGEPDAALQYHLGLEKDSATMVIGIYEGLAAREAGLNQHDVIVKVDGKSPATPAAIKEALGAKEAGDTITLTVIQKGTQRDVKVKLDGYDAEKLSSAKLIGVEPTPQIWSMLGEGRGGDVRGMAIPGLKNNELFVVPDRKGEKRELIAPVPETRMRELYRPSSKSNEGVEKQLERLDARMGELEQLLEKLIERQERRR